MFKIVYIIFKCLLCRNCVNDFHQISHRASVERVLTVCLNGSVPLNKMADMPNMVKALKNLLTQNQESFEVKSWYIVLGTQGLPSLFK